MNLAERLSHAMKTGPGAPVNANQLAIRTGLNRTAIGFVLSGQTKTLKSTNALKIADALGIRFEWLVDGDGDMTDDRSYEFESAARSVGKINEPSFDASSYTNTASIRQLDVRASMGTGADLQEHVEVVRMMQVNLADLRRVLPTFTSPQNLVIITGLGDSMKGTFRDGDPIIVDTGVKEVTVDGVYVLEREGSELFIKRVQRQLDGSLMMISDNSRYPPQHISEESRRQFKVVGRALGVWNFEKL